MSAELSNDVMIYRWHAGALTLLDYCDMAEVSIEAADSWLVTNGLALALDLHRRRFLDSVARQGFTLPDSVVFWDAAIEAIPKEGDWFPRVELQSRSGAPLLIFRRRPAPDRTRSVRLTTHLGEDPRRVPRIKGPDFAAMLRIRTEAQARGADEAVILSPLGFVIEGASSALLWWRGDTICAPAEEFDRVDSITAKSVLTLATALDIDVYHEAITPEELDGREVWALNALQGIRIVTDWVDGPELAEIPGRLETWRRRLDALRRPISADPSTDQFS
jgi:branched-subunit amino acid aminotransferase/4-amino-4-deoxychorismate lyase